MLSRYSEDEMWSWFAIELVLWPQEVTFARWTQPSGPLCLWQCLFTRWSIINNRYKKSGGQAWIFGRKHCFLPIIGSQLIWQLKYTWCWWNARVLKILKDFFSTKLLKFFGDSSTYKSWCRPKHLFLKRGPHYDSIIEYIIVKYDLWRQQCFALLQLFFYNFVRV